MRQRLRGILARVDRLATHIAPAQPDIEAMTDGELEAYACSLYERKLGRPLASFANADEVFVALHKAGLGAREAAAEEMLRGSWERAHWFVEHDQGNARHTISVTATWYAPGVEATCSCGSTIRLHREVLAEQHRAGMPSSLP